jgi:membrane protein DedA with SNARE-associated domain
MNKLIFANFVIVIGFCVMTLSGICTGVIGLGTLLSSGNMNSEIFVLSLIVGGVPCLIGCAVFFLGRKLKRDALKHERQIAPSNAPPPRD